MCALSFYVACMSESPNVPVLLLLFFHQAKVITKLREYHEVLREL